MILAVDFNVNFAINNSKPLIKFLKKEFELRINNDSWQYTTKQGTTKDVFFQDTFMTLLPIHL